MQQKYDLEMRLIDFAARIIDVTEALPRTVAGNHIGSQLIRSGTSPALHYGEAQAAESRGDFIHKMKICLKELRETHNNLRLIQKKNWYPESGLALLLTENHQLISIFFSSITTAQKNEHKKKTA